MENIPSEELVEYAVSVKSNAHLVRAVKLIQGSDECLYNLRATDDTATFLKKNETRRRWEGNDLSSGE